METLVCRWSSHLERESRSRRMVDEEVARLLRQAEARAIDLLRSHRPQLDELAERLISEETVDGKVVLEILHREPQLGGATSGA